MVLFLESAASIELKGVGLDMKTGATLDLLQKICGQLHIDVFDQATI